MSKRQLLQAVAVIATATILSKILGFLREVTLAARFGATSQTDAYLVASVIPVLLSGVLGTSLTVTVIPVLSEYLGLRGRSAAFRLANNLLNVSLVLSFGLTALGEVLAPQLVHLVSPGFHGTVHLLAVRLTRIMLPALVFHMLTGLLTAILQALGRFTAPALVGVPFNLLIIGSILFLGPAFGVGGVAVGTLVAIASQVILQLPAMSSAGFKYEFVFDLRDPGLRKIGRLILPVVLGSSATQVGLVVDRMLASELSVGSISALSYAQKLSALPQGVVALAISTVLYPRLSRAATTQDWPGYRWTLSQGIRTLAFSMMPLMAGLIVLREPIVRVLFQRGAFDAASTSATAFALLFFSVGLVAVALNDLVTKAYFAIQDTKTPLLVGVGSVIVNIVFNLVLVRYLAHGGLALGTSLAAFFAVIAMLSLLRRRMQGLFGAGVLRSLLVSLLAAIVMGIAVKVFYGLVQPFSPSGLIGEFMPLGSSIAFGGVAYLVVSWVAGSPEMGFMLDLAHKGWKQVLKKRVA